MENCWEVLKCGREADCPAYPNQGTECFAVTATICRGERQGAYEAKIEQCRQKCTFYKKTMSGGNPDLWS
jgi:methyl-accepting chemotaxis protein